MKTFKKSNIGPSNTTHNRIFEYDFIRIIAILGVLMIHCSAEYVIQFPTNSLRFQIGNFLNSTSRLAIPCFILLSGRFMLDENRVEPAPKIAKKIFKLFLILITWSTFYALCFPSGSFLADIFYGHYHLWYLYIAIGLYFMTPILRLITKKENKIYVYYFLILSLLFNYIPPFLDIILQNRQYMIARYTDSFAVHVTCGYLPLYLLGWLINQDFEILKKHVVIIGITAICALLVVDLGTYFYASPTFQAYHFFYDQRQLPVVVYGTSAFILLQIFAQKISAKISEKTKNMMVVLGRLVLGIYTVHIFILKKIIELIDHYFNLGFGNCNMFLYLASIYIPTLVLSAAIIYMISKTKYLKEIVKI